MVAGLIKKYQTTLTKTSRLKRVFQLHKNFDEKYELLKIYISTAHTNFLEGEHQSVIYENMLILDRLILEVNEGVNKFAA
ncbi:hypothetical protein CRU94_08210 [Arcobacter sp. AHV-9/2010]|uniref:hypothetical protein n=1 Tax=Arcobacter sp. AHV-9/2010 TaxID=2021861 RepID=UPI001027A372|nr:hypothetical protein [Arcobacter sp. CECT 9299]RXJ94739.1 hypothetical protein CRU94_08210 [Arcobacter sp. CECT 9299]